MGQMSNEDAARILDPETSREALAPYAHDCQLRLEDAQYDLLSDRTVIPFED